MFVLPANPYEILGVAKTAQIPEIRQAHRKLVLKCHPDKVSDPQQKAVKAEEFQKVQRAYEMLSNETERQKYDDMVRANQMEEENKRRRAEQAAAYPTPGRTPPRAEPEAATYPAYNLKVRTAEPPPSFMRSNTMPTPAKGGPYSTRTPSHSYEEFSPDESREPRSAKKSAPTYDRESKREEEKRRKKKEDEEWERQLRKQEQRKREEARERERRDKEKERERREKEKRRAERAEKDRKRDADEKRGRSKQPTVDVQPVEDEREREREREMPPHIVDAAPKTDKTPKSKSTSRPKHEHVVSDHEGPATGGAADKHRQNLDTAIQYLENTRSKGKTQQQAKTPLTRAATYHTTAPTYARQMPPPAVETPPPANPAVAPPPPPPQQSSRPVYADEETVRRSSAKSSARRMSHDTPRPRDKIFASSSSHKKSSRQQASDDEFRSPPPLKKSMTMPAQKHYAPPEVPDSPPKMHRAQTDTYSRPIPGGNPPAMSRSHTHTWYAAPSAEEDSYRPRRYTTDDDSEDERHRRGRRARSPEPVTRTSAVRYRVAPPTDGRAPRTRAMSPRSKPPKTSYYASAEEPSWDSRPSYDAYEAGGGSGGYYPSKVKYSSYENPTYSNSAYKATEHPASVYGY